MTLKDGLRFLFFFFFLPIVALLRITRLVGSSTAWSRSQLATWRQSILRTNSSKRSRDQVDQDAQAPNLTTTMALNEQSTGRARTASRAR